jgi:16S rRNA (adenine1518-N6/adenine1519-N6)-dimethyltransferase
MVPRTSPAIAQDEHTAFAELVRQAFSQRRKTLKNTLRGICGPDVIDAAGIDPGKRPQELGVEDYIRLFRQIH